MIREELNQLNSLKKEIAELEATIGRLRQQRSEVATDKVRSSGHEYPYINGYKQISGFNIAADNKRKKLLKRKTELLIKRKEKAEAAELKIMKYINSVQDSRVRRIMQYRYINGYSWEETARFLGCHRTYPKKIIDQYFENLEEPCSE